MFERDINSPIMKAYLDCMAKYQKTYASKTSIATRYQNFKKNFLKIETHNKDKEAPFEMEINEHSDMTEEEFE
jgi:hypothetical protein